jgi:hypothetical protein
MGIETVRHALRLSALSLALAGAAKDSRGAPSFPLRSADVE